MPKPPRRGGSSHASCPDSLPRSGESSQRTISRPILRPSRRTRVYPTRGRTPRNSRKALDERGGEASAHQTVAGADGYASGRDASDSVSSLVVTFGELPVPRDGGKSPSEP